ncbi:MAG: hypothetical protein LBR70_02155 [Lactobacillaceae bacterium]|jgi:hypothetical protein|nr:hypothetical protein [Lactobacillaceae bacterium]
MKKVLLLVVLFVLAGCAAGEFEGRDKFYGNETSAGMCAANPDLCSDDTDW